MRAVTRDAVVVDLALFRRSREAQLDPRQRLADQLGREAAIGIRLQAGLTAKVLAFRCPEIKSDRVARR